MLYFPDNCCYFVITRLAEKKASIGYTYEDSTVTEPDPLSDKGEEEDSENSESEGDEGIPDIGEQPWSFSFPYSGSTHLASFLLPHECECVCGCVRC